MSTVTPEALDRLLDKAADVGDSARSAGLPIDLHEFLDHYYRYVSPQDLLLRDPVDVFGAAVSHLRVAGSRPPGTPVVRVSTPTVEENGWQCGHTVVEIVTDDMPFLVDSVTAELSRQDRGIHLVVHPLVDVRRDQSGRLVGVELDPIAADAPRAAGVGRRGVAPTGVVDPPRDRPRVGGGRSARHRVGPAPRAVRRPPGGRRLAPDDRDGASHRRRPPHRSAAAPGGRDRRGRGASRMARRRPLHLPRLPRIPACRGGRRRGAGAGRRLRARDPALGRGGLRIVRRPSSSRTRPRP